MIGTSNEKNSNRQNSIKVIDIIIVIIVFFMVLYVFLLNQEILLQVFVGTLLCIAVIVYAVMQYTPKEEITHSSLGQGIEKLVLLNQEGEVAREWVVQGKTSLLIGKSSTEQEVEIDLSGTEYESLINNEHAVLNCVSEAWYIEDIDSVNGVGIKKAEKRIKNKLRHESPYRINTGDTIYIANTRILVR
ncbi:MAG: FHA domain-containing protein [Carnobacterium sp.]